jgi:hypothetical protein
MLYITFVITDTLSFYLQMTMVLVVTAATVGESVISLSPDLRSVYSLIPASGFVFFFFSGLIIKSNTLPEWTQPWMPSFSVIRWAMQGMAINRLPGTLPEVTTPFGSLSLYSLIMSSLGWGGKTKNYCMNVVLLNFGIYRMLTYAALSYRSMAQTGKRTLLKADEPQSNRVL